MEKQKSSALQEEDKFILRMPDGMRDQFKNIAIANGRSLNAELNSRLNASLCVPEDVVLACAELDPIDRVDFAVKVLKRAGFQITLPTKNR